MSDATATIDAEAIRDRLYLLELAARHLPPDADWRTHPIAVEYCWLLCLWWTLPSVPCMAALYSAHPAARSFRSRLLTSRALLPDLRDTAPEVNCDNVRTPQQASLQFPYRTREDPTVKLAYQSAVREARAVFSRLASTADTIVQLRSVNMTDWQAPLRPRPHSRKREMPC